jgi:hypothetical protein
LSANNASATALMILGRKCHFTVTYTEGIFGRQASRRAMAEPSAALAGAARHAYARCRMPDAIGRRKI